MDDAILNHQDRQVDAALSSHKRARTKAQMRGVAGLLHTTCGYRLSAAARSSWCLNRALVTMAAARPRVTVHMDDDVSHVAIRYVVLSSSFLNHYCLRGANYFHGTVRVDLIQIAPLFAYCQSFYRRQAEEPQPAAR